MATSDTDGSEPADFSASIPAPSPESRDQQASGSSGASSPGVVTSSDIASPDLSSAEGAVNGMDDFQRLQRRLQLITLCLAAGAVLITALVTDRSNAISLAVGAAGSLLYLRLLGRSVSRLGEKSRSVGKAQLLVPIVLVLAASRLPQLSILPVFLGFLLYKPAVIIQALTDV